MIRTQKKRGTHPHKDALHTMAKTTPTQYWNDSCSIGELHYAIARGATGATTNPVIVKTVLEKDFSSYEKHVKKAIKDNPHATEDDIAWYMIEHAAKAGATLLKKQFSPTTGAGRISIQTNTKYYQNASKLIQQTLHFASLAPNVHVKLPATKSGIEAMEKVTYEGVSVNATVCFTVPQALAVAEAIERALTRREDTGKSITTIHPVCTIMVGRLDDWLKVIAERDGIIVDPEALEWAGVACMKRAYQLYQEKGYRTKLLAAAYRNHYHWSEFIGGDIIETIPYKWQLRFNKSTIEVKNRMHTPVDSALIRQLTRHFRDFKKAYEPKGLNTAQFDSYGATARTLLQFATGYDELVKIARSAMIAVK